MYQLIDKRWTLAILPVALLMLTACGGGWQAADKALCGPHGSVATPAGWMHLSLPDSDMLSKNGPYLEYMLIQARPLAQPFRFTKRRLSVGMLPHEAAELIVDNLRADPMIRDFRLQASEPVMLDGQAGFKLTYGYLDKHDVELKTIHYGVVLPDRFINLRYTAARRYYFDNELATFNQLVGSLRLSSGCLAPSSASQVGGAYLSNGYQGSKPGKN